MELLSWWDKSVKIGFNRQRCSNGLKSKNLEKLTSRVGKTQTKSVSTSKQKSKTMKAEKWKKWSKYNDLWKKRQDSGTLCYLAGTITQNGSSKNDIHIRNGKAIQASGKNIENFSQAIKTRLKKSLVCYMNQKNSSWQKWIWKTGSITS